MKKYLNMMLALSGAVLLYSCSTQEPDGSQYAASPSIEIVSKDDVFPSEGGTGTIVVNTRETVTAASDRTWLTVSVSGRSIYLTATENETLESRYASVSIKAGEAASEITVQQFGVTSELMWESSYDFPYGGDELSLGFSESGVIRVTVPEGKDWISVDVEDKVLTITTSPNAYKASREGKVRFSAGEKVREVGVVQAGNPGGLNPDDPTPQEFILQEGWTPKYIGLSEDDETKAVIGVDEAEGASLGRYFIKVVTAAEYNAAGNQYIFLNINAHAWAAANPEIHRGTSTEEIDALAFGDYFIYAIGVNNQGAVNYKYAVTPVTVSKVLSPYEKFLGTWSFPRGDGTDTWTVTENVPDQSYYITGIDGKEESIKVVANFNAETGAITVSTQTNLGESTVNTSSGQLSGQTNLLGKIDYNGTIYRITGNYPIFTVKISEDASKADLVPGTVNIASLGGEFTLMGFAIYTVVGDSWYALTTGSTLPNTITHLSQGSGSGGGGNEGGGGGGGGGGDDTAGYNGWIGTWDAGSGRTVTFAQKTAGTDYTVTDSGYGGFEYVATYDASTGGIRLNLQMVDEYDIDQYYFIGINGNSLISGDPENDYLIATGSLGSNGSSATITAVSYTTSNGNAQAAAITILDYQTEDGGGYEKGWYGLNGIEDLELPATLTKASGSSLSVSRSDAAVELSTGEISVTPRATSKKQDKRIRIR